MSHKVALVTGAAKRIGAKIAQFLHKNDFNVVIHYQHSRETASKLCNELNALRSESCILMSGDIAVVANCRRIIKETHQRWDRLDALINNASSFYPTPLLEATEDEWDNLVGSNQKGPFFLAQAAAPLLKAVNGNIVNIVDIHGEKPLKNYPIYCSAKAGLIMLTKALARELAPEVRVNAIAPGAILWPTEQNTLSATAKQHILDRTLLKRIGQPDDIAKTVLFLLQQNYITGQVIAVDGGRSIKD